MADNIRDIRQGYWRCDALPQLVIRTTCNSIKSYKAHSHSELSLGLIEAGQTCLSARGADITLSSGDMVLIEPHLVHACNPVQGLPRSYRMLYIDHQWCCDVLSECYQQKVTRFICEKGMLLVSDKENELPGLISTLTESCAPRDVSLVHERLRSVVQAYCSPLLNSEEDDGIAYRVREWLLEQVESPPSIEDIARQVGRTPESVIRNFKRRFGITPRAFLNNCRVEKAKRLLRTGMKIADVALEVGYSDQSQLHKAFVSYTASTPGQYQNSPNKNNSSMNNRVNFRQ
ncbi:AraC family transcriptional regulator [Vibrio albus]|uniref:AraC family transcriptional regulator n=1 Tax=Vibrio albus TaxID=2200953 RepID=A0A2U3BAM2_9VIBR|nr:AraC family transcriptional regulator [Vibrio albus]PWI33840.1 AraC family transcriptional regulator [Vibrio albus]